MKKFLFIVLITLSLPARADVFFYPLKEEDKTKLQEIIKPSPVQESDFIQTKKISGLDKELISSGKLLYAKNKGIYWKIKQPFSVTYVFTEKGLLQVADDEKKMIEAGSQAAISQFSNVMQAVFSGDYDILKKYFDIFFTGENGGWTLGLRPTDSAIQSVISEIVVSGHENTESVFFTETSGDTTKIELQKFNQKEKLSKIDENLFDF